MSRDNDSNPFYALFKKPIGFLLISNMLILIFILLWKFDYISVEWLMMAGLLDILINRPVMNKFRLRALGITYKFSRSEMIFIVPFKYYKKLMYG